VSNDLNVGGHLSLGRDPRATVQWAAENGFRSMQIFASSPGAWKPPVEDPARIDDFRGARAEFEIDPLIIHAIYLINLASDDPALVRRAKSSLVATLRAGERMGASAVITHIGSHGGRGYEEVADGVAAALIEILEKAPPAIDLALENNAGQGNCLGSELWELADLIHRAGNHPRLKVGLDTAHLCAAGWDFQAPDAAELLVEEIEATFSLQRLILIHANDSKVPCGSRRDRHANIGDGHIGLDGFRHLLAMPALRRVPWILETPDLERRADDLTKLHALSVQPLPAGADHAS
jgi:deoxyribonuclease-4